MALKTHQKENQILKYVNSDSMHTNVCCHKSTPTRIIHQLKILTTLHLENMDMRIEMLCPDHKAARKQFS